MGGIDSYTKLMLHMDGADGSTTFTDSSLSPKTITRYGNAQIDTAQSVFGGAAGLFDGSGDYLTIPDSDDWNFGAGDYTVECWYMPLSLTGDAQWRGLICQRYSYNSNHSWSLSVDQNNNGFLFEWTTNGTDIVSVSFGGALSIGVWYHVSVSRVGATLYCGVAGTVTERTGTSSALYNSSNVIAIGRLNISTTQTTYDIHGRIDEVRISKGIARWTSDFTPPTSAYNNYVSDLSLGDFNKTFSLELTKDIIELIRSLSLNDFDSDFSIGLTKELLEAIKTINISNIDEYTKLLIHGDGEEGSQLFYDSSELHEISVVGTLPQVSSTSKFGTGSIQFTRPVYVSGNYLTVPNSQDWDIFVSGLDVTIDFWINIQADGMNGVLQLMDPIDEWGWILMVGFELAGELQISWECYNSDWDTVSYISAISLGIEHNTWNHVAVVIHNDVPMIFLNGQSLTLSNSDHLLLPTTFPDNSLRIGSNYGYAAKAKIDELRISKGIARWTSNFTPPTEPYGTNGDFNSTSSLELLQDYQGILTRSLGDFDIYSSFELLKSLEKLLSIGDFDFNQTWYLQRIQSVVSSLILKNSFLLGTSLILKYDIPPLTDINSNMLLINSLIGSVEGNLQILNRLTEPVTGNLRLRNKLTDKNEVEGTLTLKNSIDPQSTPPTYTDLEQDQANFESGLTDPSSPNYNPQLASLTYFYFTEEHTG
jgi:hypothetical protein